MRRLGGILMALSLALTAGFAVGCGSTDRTVASSATPTATASATPTVTPTPMDGPVITFFGILRPDDTLIESSGTNPDGLPVYSRDTGSQFRIVVEGKPGPTGAAIGDSSYQEDLSSFPDLQIEVSRTLGDGSATVCDVARNTATPGGVPSTVPTDFEPTQTNINTVNDLACRFRDGQYQPRGVTRDAACVKFLPGEDYDFVDAQSTLEFCSIILTSYEAFLSGDTVVTARLRDIHGHVGKPAQIVIHIGP